MAEASAAPVVFTTQGDLSGRAALDRRATVTSVTTVTNSDGTVNLWSTSAAPYTANVSDTNYVEVGTRFIPNVDGQVVGLRFYKGSRNTGTHVGSLWGPDGTRLAKVTFTNESASGWQTATFASPVSVSVGKTYTISYLAPVGRYSVTRHYFDLAGVVTGSLTTPAGAGVYRYGGAGTMPTSVTANTNYWVDVTFRPGTSSLTPTPTPTSTTTTSPSPSPTPTPTTTTTTPPSGTLRDKYQWPFSATSIWNMPIGTGAVYAPLVLKAPSIGYGTDEEYLQFSTTAPLRSLIQRGYWWPWTSGTSVPGSSTGVQVRVPDNWIVAPPASDDYPNRASAALQSDGLAREFQYTVRPTTGSDISMYGGARSAWDLKGDGLTKSGMFGAHGGSGLNGIGGTIRTGELTGTQPIRHALAVTMNMAKWGTKQGGNVTNGYRWPAVAADSYYADTGFATGYGTENSSGGFSNDGLGMGSLLALPASVDLASLNFETPQGAKIAWTYQNYGAYVVDDSADPNGTWDVHRHNVEIGVLKEFPAIDTGMTTNTPFGRDMNKIFTRLTVVDNNGPSSVGGGGTPRQQLAPDFLN